MCADQQSISMGHKMVMCHICKQSLFRTTEFKTADTISGFLGLSRVLIIE